MTRRKVRLGLLQMRMQEDPISNLERAVALIERAANGGANLVCLPELFTTKYFAQYEAKDEVPSELLDTVPGKASGLLSAAARKNGVVVIGGSIFESDKDKMFNTSMVFDPRGKLLGIYRKTHIPQDQHYFEQEYFTPGDTGFQVFDTEFGRFSVMICYDQWFPEAARVSALKGAEMAFYPTAIGTVKGIKQTEGNWHRAWENVMRGHAIANGMAVAGINRVGREDQMSFWGGSFAIDAFGKTLKRAGRDETALLVDVDLDHGREVREGWGFFSNRRPECYSRLTERA